MSSLVWFGPNLYMWWSGDYILSGVIGNQDILQFASMNCIAKLISSAFRAASSRSSTPRCLTAQISEDGRMSKRVRKLLGEAKARCDEEPGRQARLARWLGVHRQSVSAWFSEFQSEHPCKQPTAEQALALQEFLKEQRRLKARGF